MLARGYPECRTTHAKDLYPLGSFATGFSTPRPRPACSRQLNFPCQILWCLDPLEEGRCLLIVILSLW